MNQVFKDFMQATAQKNISTPPQVQGVPQPPLEMPLGPWEELVELPDPASLEFGSVDLRTTIESRTSVRRYSEQALALEELSYLLWLTQGVKEVTKRPATLRTVPSAGARHAFETYLLVNRVTGLESGLYRFASCDHGLTRQMTGDRDMNAEITQACMQQRQVATGAVTFIWTAVLERMTWRYAQRGYRYLLLDAGHVCQNLYLAAEALGCGTCAIAAFDDDLLNLTLGLDGETIFALYAASVGKKEAGQSA
jgi:SagB-type dehydrogenase family enzyme